MALLIFNLFFLIFPLSKNISQQNFAQSKAHFLESSCFSLEFVKILIGRFSGALIMYAASIPKKWSCPLLTKAQVRRSLYLAIVKPDFCYANEVWSPGIMSH